MTDDLAVTATALTKNFGSARVLDGVDLQVRSGEIVALLGPNGAGKTTTVRILTTLTELDEGSARVAGADIRTERHLVRQRIALTGQFAALDELQTGRENLRMTARLARLSRPASRRRADALLDRFDLAAAADRRVATYSGGMRRRLDLAASLVADPQVLFLDEPTTGLDPRSRAEVWTVVAELARGGTAVLLTTQYLEEADRLADQIALLDSGRLVASGTATSLKARIAGDRLDLVAADPAAYGRLGRRLAERVTHRDEPSLTLGVALAASAAGVRRLFDDIDPDATDIATFGLHRASLDDVFLSLTSRQDATRDASKEPAHV